MNVFLFGNDVCSVIHVHGIIREKKSSDERINVWEGLSLLLYLQSLNRDIGC